MPPIFTVVTENRGLNTGGRANLSADAFGVPGGGLTGIQFGSSWPGGDSNARIQLDLPLDFDSPAIRLGRRLIVYAGAQPVFHGLMDDPQRGSPWEITAIGLGPSGAKNAVCVFSASPPPANPTNDAVDQAIGRGAVQWRRTGSLPDPSEVPPDDPGMMEDYLSLVASSDATPNSGQQWGVFADAAIVFPGSASVKWLIDGADTPGGRSFGEFWTAVVARYMDSAFSPPKIKTVVKTNPDWVGQVRIEKLADLTGHGPLNSGQATAFIQNVLLATAPQPTFTGSMTVRREHLRGAGGAPGEPAMVRAGDIARFQGVVADPYTGLLDYATPVDAQIGDVTYDAESDTLQLTPVAATARDLVGVLAAVTADRLRKPLVAVS